MCARFYDDRVRDYKFIKSNFQSSVHALFAKATGKSSNAMTSCRSLENEVWTSIKAVTTSCHRNDSNSLHHRHA